MRFTPGPSFDVHTQDVYVEVMTIRRFNHDA